MICLWIQFQRSFSAPFLCVIYYIYLSRVCLKWQGFFPFRNTESISKKCCFGHHIYLLFGLLSSLVRTLVIVFGYKMSKKQWAIAGCVIFVLVVVGVGLFVFFYERPAKSLGRWRQCFTLIRRIMYHKTSLYIIRSTCFSYAPNITSQKVSYSF